MLEHGVYAQVFHAERTREADRTAKINSLICVIRYPHAGTREICSRPVYWYLGASAVMRNKSDPAGTEN